MKNRIKFLGRNQQGGALVPTALAMIAFIALLAIVIDLGHLHNVRQELLNAAEAGALAGARALLPLKPEDYNKADPPPYCAKALTTARDAAAGNLADKTAVTVLVTDTKTVRWDWQQNKISSTNPTCDLDANTGVNGIRVTTRLSSDVPAGGVLMTFGKIFGIDTMDVVVSATAAMGYATGLTGGAFNNIAADKGALKEWRNDELIGIKEFLMTPDKNDNAAWSAASPYTPSNATIKNWLNTGTSPAVPENGTVNLNNGQLADLLKVVGDLITKNYDPDLGGMLVVFPVVDAPGGKMLGSLPVVGFQALILKRVDTGKDKGIWVKFYDGPVPQGGTTPGGTYIPGSYTPVYTMPKLVE